MLQLNEKGLFDIDGKKLKMYEVFEEDPALLALRMMTKKDPELDFFSEDIALKLLKDYSEVNLEAMKLQYNREVMRDIRAKARAGTKGFEKPVRKTPVRKTSVPIKLDKGVAIRSDFGKYDSIDFVNYTRYDVGGC